MSHLGKTHAAMMKGASKETIKNRKKKLYAKIDRLIDNTTLSGGDKVFLKGNIKAIAKELASIEYWRIENDN
nr:MAG TPA: hypothetical protein [Caudoviricetes sp.]